MTFGGEPVAATLGAGGIITLNTGAQAAFSLPYDAVLEAVYATVGTWVSFSFPGGLNVFPAVQVYVAARDSNVFMPLPQTRAAPSQGFGGSVPANTMRPASRTGLGIRLAAGTRLLIVGLMQIRGSGTLNQSYYFYYTGGLAFLSAA